MRHWKTAATAVTVCILSAPLGAQTAPVPAGFTSIFDGKTLNGWKGDPNFFRVKDGTLEGGSDKPITNNTFLVLNKPYPNFELRFKYRWVTDVGNSGIQFRSFLIDPDHYYMVGMQANVTPVGKALERFAMLYEEIGERQEMVLLGQRATITRQQAAGGGQGRIVRTVHEMVNSREEIAKSIKPNDWNEDVLIVYGNRSVHAVNGFLAYDATDNDPMGSKTGYIGIQVHKGPPMTVQFKDVVIRPLTSFPNIDGRFKVTRSPAPAPAVTYKDSTKVNFPDTPLP